MERTIKNFDALACPEHIEGAENDLRRDALEIAETGYEAIDVGNALRNKLRIENDGLRIGEREYHLVGRRIFFVGVGKCAFAAARAIEELFGERLTGGIALDVAPIENNSLTKIETFIGTHPLPSEANVRAAKRIIEFLSNCNKDDLVIMLISGGGSTLLCFPEEPMAFADESKLFTELTSQGASIQDMNIVRKHLSRARGGFLARAAYPAEILSLVVSDVPGNNLEFISSGPTIMDSSTIADAKAVLAKYGVVPSENIVFIETPKEEKYFEHVANILFLSNSDALIAMQKKAIQLGYETEIVDEQFSGEARDVGRNIIEKLHAAQMKTALLYAGESTVELGESFGVGGRNQEMALAALSEIRDDELMLPFASDGRDNTDHAGAIGDSVSRAHANTRNLSIEEYLDAHRSYDFFSATDDAMLTGYTGSNVADLIIALKK
jgi:glycerate-2-kinase